MHKPAVKAAIKNGEIKRMLINNTSSLPFGKDAEYVLDGLQCRGYNVPRSATPVFDQDVTNGFLLEKMRNRSSDASVRVATSSFDKLVFSVPYLRGVNKLKLHLAAR